MNTSSSAAIDQLGTHVSHLACLARIDAGTHLARGDTNASEATTEAAANKATHDNRAMGNETDVCSVEASRPAALVPQKGGCGVERFGGYPTVDQP